MPLNLSQLQSQLDHLGQEAKSQAEQRQRHQADAYRWLSEQGDDLERLQALATQATNNHWPVAWPIETPLYDHRDLPAHPSRITLVATDGSPIAPDRHGAALYYVINIGSIIYRHGSGQRPEIATNSELRYKREDLYEDRRLVQGNLLDVRMQTAELEALADLAEAVATEGPPVVALTDGSLLLWLLDEDREEVRKAKLQPYLDSLKRMGEANAALAGVISRPRHREVIDLLFLAAQPQGTPLDFRQLRDQAHALDLADRDLFATLPPGACSVAFRSAMSFDDSHEADLCFTYLNVGDAKAAEIVRVEVPRWVMRNSVLVEGHTMSMLQLAHTAIDQQCRILRRYPYVLARAHELAVVGIKERHDIEMTIQSRLAQQGLLGTPSEKKASKEAVGSTE